MSSEHSKRIKTKWKISLEFASRTALACVIVGSITLYGPTWLRQQVAFPAFSYVTVVLIITNASLGDTVRGVFHALSATVQAVCPAILCLSVVGPTRLSAPSTALVVGVAAFFITLPESTHLVAKRIALGQLVIVYVIGYINGEHTHPIMHPVHVAASTGVGAVACVLAFLLPFPALAYSQVKDNSKLFAENASERLKLFVKAFNAEDTSSLQALISQASCLAVKGRKFLHCIKSKQVRKIIREECYGQSLGQLLQLFSLYESMHWEIFPIKFLRPYCKNPGDRFQELETPLKGMEIALRNMKPPIRILDEQLNEGVVSMEGHICHNLEQIKTHLPCEILTVPESNSEHAMNLLRTLDKFPSDETELPSYFFLFCLKLLYNQSKVITILTNKPAQHKPNGLSFKNVWPNRASKKRLVPALKTSLALGFATLFGLYYSKPDGFWAGLPVAISLAAAREPTFKVANVKAQGTVIGTIYGVLGCFVFERFVKVRFLALLPWFIFTSFLQQSKMYGPAGGVSAVIGAVLILGRRNFGPPSEFAIARIVETFIGLASSIMVELMLQPKRASTLAKIQLTKTLATLRDSLYLIDLSCASMSKEEKLIEKGRLLKREVMELGKFVDEAKVEPNFWFLPFHGACYGKLVDALSKMDDLLLFSARTIGSLEGQIQRIEQMGCKQGLDKINGDLKVVKNTIESSIKYLEEVSSIKSLTKLEKDLVKNNKSFDIELGKSGCKQLNLDEKEIKKIVNSLLGHFKEFFDQTQDGEDEEEIKGEVVMSLSALGFCLGCLMSETKEIEMGIREIIQWENPTTAINLNEILCKVHALNKL